MSFKNFSKEVIESVLSEIQMLQKKRTEQSYWNASFKDGQINAEFLEQTAILIGGFISLLEQDLLERQLLEITNVQDPAPVTT